MQMCSQWEGQSLLRVGAEVMEHRNSLLLPGHLQVTQPHHLLPTNNANAGNHHSEI